MWDVVLGRESWGASVALFVPAGDGAVRQAVLHAAAYDAAMRELEAMNDAELQTLLDQSSLKEDSTG